MEKNPLNIIIHSSIGGRSHIKAVLEVAQELQTRNHRITYAALEDYLPFSNGYNISKFSLGDPIFNDVVFRENIRKQLLNERKKDLMPDMMKFMKDVMVKSYDAEFGPLQELINNTSPDLIICDFAASACLDLAKLHGVPLVIGVQTIDSFRMINEPYITRIAGYGPLTTENLSFFGRIYSMVIEPLIGMRQMWSMMKPLNQRRISFGLSPSMRVFDFNYGLGIANTFFGFETPSNIIPSLKLVGPILSKVTPMDGPLSQFFSQHDSILYVAFGSQLIPDKIDITTILKSALIALEDGQIDAVVWGLGKSSYRDFPEELLYLTQDERFMFVPWAPQRAILEHKSTKLFLSHGGLESSIEAAYSGTPVLCMPYVSDQPRNAAKLEASGIGLYVDRITATPESVYHQIQALVSDPTGAVASNSHRLKAISRSTSRQTGYAADLVESHAYVAKACRPLFPYSHPSPLPPCELTHLVPASTRMDFIRANLIDVYIFSFISTLAAIYLVLILLWRLVTFFFRATHPTKLKVA